MTVRELHKQLGKLIAAGHGRCRVCAVRCTFKHPLESDGVVYFDVSGVNVEPVLQINDDGWTKTRKDGSEVYLKCAALFGDSGTVRDGFVTWEERAADTEAPR